MIKIGIIGAMEVEVSYLKNLMAENGKQTKVYEIGGLSYFEGEISGLSCVVVKSGVGKVNAALCAQTLIYKFGATNVINTGIAGAMASGLGILDIVVSTDALYHDMDATGFGYKPTQIPQMDTSCFAADKKMIQAAVTAFSKISESKGHKIIEGRIASGDQFISDKETKNHIKRFVIQLA